MTVPYTSAQNGHVECTHCIIMDRARAICTDLDLPPSLWGESVHTSTYIKNCTLSRSMNRKTPFEVYYGKKLNLSHLCKLGCHAFMLKQGTIPKIYSQSI